MMLRLMIQPTSSMLQPVDQSGKVLTPGEFDHGVHIQHTHLKRILDVLSFLVVRGDDLYAAKHSAIQSLTETCM